MSGNVKMSEHTHTLPRLRSSFFCVQIACLHMPPRGLPTHTQTYGCVSYHRPLPPPFRCCASPSIYTTKKIQNQQNQKIETKALKNAAFQKNAVFAVFLGFNALNASEEIIFQELLSREMGTIYWDNDHYFLNNEMEEAGLFMRNYFTQKFTQTLNNSKI